MDVTTGILMFLRRFRLGGAMLVVVASLGLVGTGTALGASPSASHRTSAASDQYVKSANYAKPAKIVAGQAGNSSSGGSAPSTGTASSGTLPFTGVSLIWPAVAAVALVGLGLGLRRHERNG